MAILKKAREMFIKNVTDLTTGDSNGKQKLVRFIERVIDRRVGAAEAVVSSQVKGEDKGEGKGDGSVTQME